VNAGLGGLYRIMLIVGRTGRAGKIVYLINLRIIGKGNIVPDKFKIIAV
jgi:hypothetical protein